MGILLNAATVPGPGPALRRSPGVDMTMHVVGSVTADSGNAVVRIEVSNDGQNFIPRDTVSLSLSTVPASAGIERPAAWIYFRANVLSISGTGASVSVHTGSEA